MHPTTLVVTGASLFLLGVIGSIPTDAAETTLTFNAASSARVEINQSFPGLSNLTLSAWIKTASPPVDYAAIAGRGHLQGANGFGMFTLPDGTIAFQTRTGGTVVQAATNYTFDNQWRHIAGVRDGTNTRLYIDGTLAASAGGVLSSLDAALQFGIGARDAGGGSWAFFFTGSIADVRLWNHARSAADIQADRDRRLNGRESGLIGYWPLDDGPGSITGDRVEPGTDGSIVNAVWTHSSDLSLADLVLRQPATGSRDFTCTNGMTVAEFPYWPGYDLYQFTATNAPPQPAAWLSTSPAPNTVTFTRPATDTAYAVTAWMTNTLVPSSPLTAFTADFVITTAKPQAAVYGEISASFVPGQSSVSLSIADLSTGISGGTWPGGAIPLVVTNLFCAQDATPGAPFVTLTNAGSFDLILTLTNAAGSALTATSRVTLVERTAPYLYAATNGDNSLGTNWTTAFTSLQRAIDHSIAGDTIFIRDQEFLITNALQIVSHSALTLRGGYLGTGSPGPTGAWPSVVRRDPTGPWVRLAQILNATVSVETVTFRSGRLPSSSDRLGAGLHIANTSSVSLRRCVIADCILPALNASLSRGAGLYAERSRIEIIDSQIYSNRMDGGSWAYEAPHGAGLAAVYSTLVLSNVLIASNINVFDNGPGRGGGLYLLGGQADIADAAFVGNQVYCDRWHVYHHMGGGLYAESVTPLNIERCRFAGNQVRDSLNNPLNNGDALFLTGTGLVARVIDTTIVSNGVPVSNRVNNAVVVTDRARALFQRVQIVNNYGHGIEVGRAHAGTVALMTNVVVAGHRGHGVISLQGTNLLNNVTLADNAGWGSTNNVAVGWIRNAIVWNNGEGSLSRWTTVNYSCIAGGQAGTGNVDVDPLFGDAPNRDYHLKSRSGRWIPATQSWYGDAVSSPCLTGGDPEDDRWNLEPAPNGRELNLGAFGGTAEASKYIVANGGIWIIF